MLNAVVKTVTLASGQPTNVYLRVALTDARVFLNTVTAKSYTCGQCGRRRTVKSSHADDVRALLVASKLCLECHTSIVTDLQTQQAADAGAEAADPGRRVGRPDGQRGRAAVRHAPGEAPGDVLDVREPDGVPQHLPVLGEEAGDGGPPAAAPGRRDAVQQLRALRHVRDQAVAGRPAGRQGLHGRPAGRVRPRDARGGQSRMPAITSSPG